MTFSSCLLTLNLMCTCYIGNPKMKNSSGHMENSEKWNTKSPNQNNATKKKKLDETNMVAQRPLWQIEEQGGQV